MVTFQDTPTSPGMSLSVGFPGSPGSVASPGATSSPASLGIPNLHLSTLPTSGATGVTGATATGGASGTSSRSPRPAKIDPGPIPEGIRPELQKACEVVKKRGWKKVTWPNGFSALHLAARLGEEKAVDFLLRASAAPDMQLKDSEGKSALDYANIKGHSHLVQLLTPADPDDMPPVAEELPIGQGWSCEGSEKEIFVDLSGA
eukprot:symbB.v1.2.025560.t1/scaffold2413.1/size174923/1